MKMFNKNRKSFVGNNYRRQDRNNGYRSNDRNNKFSRKNGGRNKFIKSEQFHEEEDATPWHVMKQNIKPSISVKNPEIEDDWNADEKLKFRAAKQDFMRQKDERHRKFVIENERKSVSKWDSFSDIEQSEDEGKKTTNNCSNEYDEKEILDVVEQMVEIDETLSVSRKSKKNKLETREEAQSSKKFKINNTNPQQTVIENELNQGLLAKNKTKKKSKDSEPLQDHVIETKIEESMVTKKKLKETIIQSALPQETDIETKSDKPLIAKTKITEAVNQCKDVEETDQPMLAKKKSKKKSKQVELHTDDQIALDEATDNIDQEKKTKPKKEKNYFCNEQPGETFLESLASRKQNEPLLFESTQMTKSGPRCFACRQFGHSLKQCRDFDNNSARICIKCGSSDHAYQNCTVHKGRVFKFASCFICKETGHISSQCKEKKNGVYPDGGNCRYCSSVEHLGFNCPRRPGRQKKRKFFNKRNSKPNDKLRKVQSDGGPGRIQKYPKDNKIKRNFK